MKKRQKWIWFLIMWSVFILLPAGMVQAAGLAIQYDGKAISYKDTQVSYKLDGNRISSLYPGIIIEGVSLAPCTDIFIKPKTGITYKYSKAKGLLYLYHGTDEIRFTLGSKTAKVNGKKVTLPAAPRLITLTNKGVEKVYVPARFVAEQFGFTYSWNEKTGVASMTSPPWKIRYNGKDYNYNGKKLQVLSDDKACTTESYPGLVLNDTIMAPAKLTFAGKAVNGTYKYDSSTKRVTIKKYGNTIVMTLNSKTAKVNGKKVTLKEAPKSIKFLETGVTIIYVPLQAVAEALQYEYLPFLSDNQVKLKAPYAIYYNGAWSFPEVKGKVIFDEKEIAVSPVYSYIENNTAMIRTKKVFATTMGCSYQYDSATKTLTLGKDDKTVTFTINSMTATVNGKEQTLDVPARLVKNGTDGVYYTMVPGRFTANALGFEYEWLSESGTSVITTPEPEDDENKQPDDEKPEDDTEQSDPPANPDPVIPADASLFQWKANSVFTEYLTEVQNQAAHATEVTGRTQSGGSTAYSSLLSVEQGSELLYGSYDTYYLQSPDGFFGVTGTVSGNAIELTLSDTISTNQTYSFSGGLVTQAVVEFQEATLSTKVTLFLAQHASSEFKLMLSGDNKTLTVKIYQNCLTSITGERQSGNDILTISGTGKVQAEILSDDSDGMILLQLTGMLDTLSDMDWTDATGTGVLSNVVRIPVNNNQMQLLIQRRKENEYYLVENGSDIKLIVKGDRADLGAYSLKIPYMPGTKRDAITDSDHYMSKYFTITLPGDQLSYLDSTPIVLSGNTISEVQKKLNSAGNTVITVKTSKIQAYRLHYTSDAIMVEVDDAKNLYDKIVVLDAGHGGDDPGTIHNGVKEKDLSLQILYTRLKQYFEDSDDIKVYWTRTDDTFLELNDRAAYASKVGADLFISLHMDSFSTTKPNGISVYHSTQNKKVNSGGLTSVTLAQILQKNQVNGLGATDRKVKNNSYVVCKSNTVPAVLIELGFMSNPDEFKNLTSKSYQQKAAKILYESIVEVFEKYPTKR